jgi:hypothetical protein
MGRNAQITRHPMPMAAAAYHIDFEGGRPIMLDSSPTWGFPFSILRRRSRPSAITGNPPLCFDRSTRDFDQPNMKGCPMTRPSRIAVSALCVVFTGVLVQTGCTATSNPDDALNLSGKTFSFTLGDAGQFELILGGTPIQQATIVSLIDDEATDNPASATITIDPNKVEANGAQVSKLRPNRQAVTGSAEITIRIDGSASVLPCVNGTPVGTFILTLADSGVSIAPSTLDVSSEALAHLTGGEFSLCVEAIADTDVSLNVTEMSIAFGPAATQP